MFIYTILIDAYVRVPIHLDVPWDQLTELQQDATVNDAYNQARELEDGADLSVSTYDAWGVIDEDGDEIREVR